jgi:hypothetical protein
LHFIVPLRENRCANGKKREGAQEEQFLILSLSPLITQRCHWWPVPTRSRKRQRPCLVFPCFRSLSVVPIYLASSRTRSSDCGPVLRPLFLYPDRSNSESH